MRLVFPATALSVATLVLSATLLPDTSYESAALPLISNTINGFSYYVDSHQYTGLTQVFTSDAVFNADPTVYRGRDAIIAGLAPLDNVSSQHGYTSQYTQLTSLTTANATAYLFSNFYGQGAKKGRIFTVYGRYDFAMRLLPEGWRAQTLTLTTLVSAGVLCFIITVGEE